MFVTLPTQRNQTLQAAASEGFHVVRAVMHLEGPRGADQTLVVVTVENSTPNVGPDVGLQVLVVRLEPQGLITALLVFAFHVRRGALFSRFRAQRALTRLADANGFVPFIVALLALRVFNVVSNRSPQRVLPTPVGYLECSTGIEPAFSCAGHAAPLVCACWPWTPGRVRKPNRFHVI